MSPIGPKRTPMLSRVLVRFGWQSRQSVVGLPTYNERRKPYQLRLWRAAFDSLACFFEILGRVELGRSTKQAPERRHSCEPEQVAESNRSARSLGRRIASELSAAVCCELHHELPGKFLRQARAREL